MAKITYSLLKEENSMKERQIRLDMIVGHGARVLVRSNIWIDPKRWGRRDTITIPTTPGPEQSELLVKKEILRKLTVFIEDAILKETDKSVITKEWAERKVKLFYNPKPTRETEACISLFTLMETYLKTVNLCLSRKKHFRTLMNMLRRYEEYCQKRSRSKKLYTLDIHGLSSETLADIKQFILTEHEVCIKYPDIYKKLPNRSRVALRSARRGVEQDIPAIVSYGDLPKGAIPKPRGMNYATDLLTRFRTFYIWARDAGHTTNNPFKGFKIEESVYGEPVYITIEDRNKIYEYDMSDAPALAIQRDIFVLQCFLGCRVGDYYRFTYSNIIDNVLEYVAKKTNNDRGTVVRVPLHPIAQEIIARYYNPVRGAIMPFINEQDYNEAIKDVFKRAGITYMVTVLDPVTRLETQVPINEIASSHMARRTFVGNLCKKTKSTVIVGSMSGHDPNGRSIKRYWSVDEDLKRECIELLG